MNKKSLLSLCIFISLTCIPIAAGKGIHLKKSGRNKKPSSLLQRLSGFSPGVRSTLSKLPTAAGSMLSEALIKIKEKLTKKKDEGAKDNS